MMALKRENRKRSAASIPVSTLEPLIELVSNKEAIVEGCAGIIEYNDTAVSINCKKAIITFEGADITLKTLSSDIIEVTGVFSGIYFS